MNNIIKNLILTYQLVRIFLVFSKKNFNSIKLILGRQISLDNNISTTNDTFAFDNSLCKSNDELQPTINTEPIVPPIPPRVPRTLNGSNKSSSPS